MPPSSGRLIFSVPLTSMRSWCRNTRSCAKAKPARVKQGVQTRCDALNTRRPARFQKTLLPNLAGHQAALNPRPRRVCQNVENIMINDNDATATPG